MNNLKYFILGIFILLFLTACDVEYNLEVKSDEVIETITIMDDNENIRSRYRKDNLNELLDELIDGLKEDYITEEYKYEKILGENRSGIKMTSTSGSYNILKHTSPFLNDCFDIVTFDVVRDRIIINVNSPFYCNEFFNEGQSINVGIDTRLDVINTNAQFRGARNYSWEIDAFSDNVNINFVVDRRSGIDKLGPFSGTMQLLYVIILILGAIAAIVFYVYKRYKEANQF